MARGAGAFAEGLMTGFVQGKKLKQEQERHELEMAKAREDKALAEEMKQARANMEPAEGFEVVSPTGERMIYADEASAKEAAAALEGAQLRRQFTVGQQTFDDPEAAQAAAEALNSPAAKARRQAEVALKYNRPDMALAHQQAYRSMIEANRYDSQQRLIDARSSGDLDSVEAVLNGNMRTQGMRVELRPDGQGNVVQRWFRGDQPLRERVVPQDAFWDEAELTLSKAPDTLFEHLKFREGMRRDARDADLAERKFGLDAANTQNAMANRNAGTAQGWERINQQQQELGLRQAMSLNPAPGLIQTVDPMTGMGQVTFVGQQGQYTPGQGLQWNPQVSQPMPLPGQPASTFNTMNRPQSDPFAGLGVPTGPRLGEGLTPEQIQALGAELSKANASRGATNPDNRLQPPSGGLGPSVSGTITYPPGDPRANPALGR